MADPGHGGDLSWRVLSSRMRIDDPWFRVRQDDVLLPTEHAIDGYYVWESPDISTVVAVTEDGKFVLCRQYRHAVGRVMTQLPAGGVGRGETPEEAARRELCEETGYEAAELVHLGDTAAYPAKLSGWHHLYLAHGVRRANPRRSDPYEQVEVVLATGDELLALVAQGKFQVGDSLSAVLLAAHRFPSLFSCP